MPIMTDNISESKILKCVKCGYCCSKGPCGFGESSLPDSPQCKYLTEEKLCAIYDEIIKDPSSIVSPAFGAGCSSSLLNDCRSSKIRDNYKEYLLKRCKKCHKIYLIDQQDGNRVSFCECSFE